MAEFFGYILRNQVYKGSETSYACQMGNLVAKRASGKTTRDMMAAAALLYGDVGY